MLIEDQLMGYRVWARRLCLLLLCVSALVSCTKPNPRDCSDGTCTDPAYPFCDIDGSFGATTMTCIAVDCEPGAFEACRGDTSIVCNTAGNDFDLVACERGCDAMHGCRACTIDEGCANPMPICDTAINQCRGCEEDDECPSRVCDEGSCVAESAILYAAPNGLDSSGSCGLAAPCSLSRTFMLAFGAATPPIVRLLPGVYPSGITISTRTSATFRIVATGASIAGPAALQVLDGADVSIKGVTLTGSGTETVRCTSSSTFSTLAIRDAVIAAVGSANALYVANCSLRVDASELRPAPGAAAISAGNSGLVAGDRLHVHNGSGTVLIMGIGQGFFFQFTNSILDDVGFILSEQGTTASSLVLGFNTIILPDGVGLQCEPSTYLRLNYENNIIVARNALSALDTGTCTARYNVLFPQPTPPPTNIAADPQFVDGANKNYRLQATSPAIDGALGAGTIGPLPPTPDFDGVSRPQGAAPDMGAFERLP